jgi:hypothetical protein
MIDGHYWTTFVAIDEHTNLPLYLFRYHFIHFNQHTTYCACTCTRQAMHDIWSIDHMEGKNGLILPVEKDVCDFSNSLVNADVLLKH